MRTAICLAACLFTTSLTDAARAAAITVTAEPGPAGTLRVQPVFVDVTEPSSWAVKSPTGPNPFLLDGWQPFTRDNTNPGVFPPVWEFVQDFYVDLVEAKFLWRPWQAGIPDFAVVDVAEFVAAGDTALTMRVDTDEWGFGDFQVITWESPNLGVVTRTYQRTPVPAAALLALGAALSQTLWPRRRR